MVRRAHTSKVEAGTMAEGPGLHGRFIEVTPSRIPGLSAPLRPLRGLLAGEVDERLASRQSSVPEGGERLSTVARYVSSPR